MLLVSTWGSSKFNIHTDDLLCRCQHYKKTQHSTFIALQLGVYTLV